MTLNKIIEPDRLLIYNEQPQLVFCANVLRFDCGCICEWQFVGTFAHIPEYHVIPCYKHTENREGIEQLAALYWEQVTSEVRK